MEKEKRKDKNIVKKIPKFTMIDPILTFSIKTAIAKLRTVIYTAKIL